MPKTDEPGGGVGLGGVTALAGVTPPVVAWPGVVGALREARSKLPAEVAGVGAFGAAGVELASPAGAPPEAGIELGPRPQALCEC